MTPLRSLSKAETCPRVEIFAENIDLALRASVCGDPSLHHYKKTEFGKDSRACRRAAVLLGNGILIV